ncbi:MAG: sulfotransferase domain-containing protein [Pseudomonadota bacterium]
MNLAPVVLPTRTRAVSRPDAELQPPDFIMIGAMKAATSTVSRWLESHPDVFMVAGQDPNHFSRDEFWGQGAARYNALFADAGPGQLCGEGTNNYTSDALFPHAARRLVASCPQVRLIYMVRDPVARIISHWIQVRADQGDVAPPSLDQAVREMPERFVVPSLYWRQLSRYRALVPDARIHIGFMEDLQAAPEVFFDGLADFLGIAPHRVQDRDAHRNPSAGKRLPGQAYTRLRALPGLRQTARVIPESVRRILKDRLLSRPVSDRPRFSEPVLATLRATLAEDTAALLAHCGKPADFWSG